MKKDIKIICNRRFFKTIKEIVCVKSTSSAIR